MRTTRTLIGGGAILCLLAAAPATGPAPRSAHVDAAERLVRSIAADHNQYAYTDLSLRWQGLDGAAASEAHCDCSGFMMLLLMHTYGYTQAQIKAWTGHTRPLAHDFYEQVEAGHGFTRIPRVADIRRGDLIVVKYQDGLKKDTGHVMLAADTPRPLAPTEAAQPPGLTQWEVLVIDSAKSGHGPNDTRRKPDGTSGTGVGEGSLRLYADSAGGVAGYAWSTAPTSTFYPLSNAHRVLVGRLAPDFQP